VAEEVISDSLTALHICMCIYTGGAPGAIGGASGGGDSVVRAVPVAKGPVGDVVPMAWEQDKESESVAVGKRKTDEAELSVNREEKKKRVDRSDQGWNNLLDKRVVQVGDTIRHQSTKKDDTRRFGTVQEDGKIKEKNKEGEVIWNNPVAFASRDNGWHVADEDFRKHRNKFSTCVLVVGTDETKLEKNLVIRIGGGQGGRGVKEEAGQSSKEFQKAVKDR
jgi:hypothetical protein